MNFHTSSLSNLTPFAAEFRESSSVVRGVAFNGDMFKVGVLHNNWLHGHCSSKKSKEYLSWVNMKTRCYNPNNKYYQRYGGRGIGVCDRWRNSFANFLNDMGTKPTAKHTIERINNDLGYSPENCRWSTYLQQGSNKCNNVILTCNGQSNIIAEWSRISGIPFRAIHRRLKAGWSMCDSIFKPLDQVKAANTRKMHAKKRLFA